jgi:magnesium-transporting ATPase (P-type)
VTRLASIEEMAGMNMLCSDKTGTLTLNKMVIQDDCPIYTQGVTQQSQPFLVHTLLFSCFIYADLCCFLVFHYAETLTLLLSWSHYSETRASENNTAKATADNGGVFTRWFCCFPAHQV